MPRQTTKSLAKEIQARWPDLQVTVVRGYCNTDRKCGRLRIEGKGRWGSRLIVRDSAGQLVLDHNNAETYRSTDEIVYWMGQYAKDHG